MTSLGLADNVLDKSGGEQGYVARRHASMMFRDAHNTPAAV